MIPALLCALGVAMTLPNLSSPQLTHLAGGAGIVLMLLYARGIAGYAWALWGLYCLLAVSWSLFPGATENQAHVVLAAGGAYSCARWGPGQWRPVAVLVYLTVLPALLLVGSLVPGQANLAASCCLLGIPLAFHIGGRWQNIVAPALFIALAFSSSRGAWLAGGVVLALLAWRRLTVKAFALAFGALAFLGLLFTYQEPLGRIVHWGPAIGRWALSPWFGSGFIRRLAHNDIIQAAADFGLVGLALFLFALISALASMRKADAPLVAAVVAVVLHSVVDFPLTAPATLIAWAAIAGGARAADSAPSS